VTDLYTDLLNSGPQPLEDPNRLTIPMRQDGVAKFNPRSGYRGSVKQGGGQTTPVVYIEGKHPPESVIPVWLEANQKTVNAVGEWAIHQRISSYGERWKDASREVLEASPHDGEYHGDGHTNMDACPMCGDKVSRSLSRHLEECDSS
jgi:hypothetical protein